MMSSEASFPSAKGLPRESRALYYCSRYCWKSVAEKKHFTLVPRAIRVWRQEEPRFRDYIKIDEKSPVWRVFDVMRKRNTPRKPSLSSEEN